MASEGLSRRRVANASSSNTTDDDDHRQPSSSHSSTTPASAHHPHSHGGSAFEGGSKVAYDPRDLEANDEEEKIGGIIPRLTIMEEVLLLGLKDRQVSADPPLLSVVRSRPLLSRATSLSGTTTSRMHSVGVSSLNSPSDGESPSHAIPIAQKFPSPNVLSKSSTSA